jgi:hypothetical protein
MRSWKQTIVIAVLLLVVIVGVLPVVLPRMKQAQPGYVTGDPLDIRLVGIQPGCSLSIVDVNGRKIDETFGSERHYAYYSKGWLQRMYIFEMPRTADRVTLSYGTEGRPSECPAARTGLGIELSGGGSGIDERGRIYCMFHQPDKYQAHPRFPFLMRMPILSRYFGYTQKPYTNIDITLRYWQGPRGKADFTFAGPFAVGKTFQAQDGAPGTLVFSDFYSAGGGWGVQALFNGTGRFMGYAEFLAYDKDGNRRHVNGKGGNASPTSSTMMFEIPNCRAEDVAYITFGEKPRERTFHRVPVAFPNLPERAYPEYLDDVSKRLGLAGTQRADMEHFSCQSAEEALKIIDLMRDRQASWAGSLTACFPIPQSGSSPMRRPLACGKPLTCGLQPRIGTSGNWASRWVST